MKIRASVNLCAHGNAKADNVAIPGIKIGRVKAKHPQSASTSSSDSEAGTDITESDPSDDADATDSETGSCVRRHMMSKHAGEMPYECPSCGRRFAQKISLTRHQSTHTREESHECSQCGAKFGAQRNLEGTSGPTLKRGRTSALMYGCVRQEGHIEMPHTDPHCSPIKRRSDITVSSTTVRRTPPRVTQAHTELPLAVLVTNAAKNIRKSDTLTTVAPAAGTSLTGKRWRDTNNNTRAETISLCDHQTPAPPDDDRNAAVEENDANGVFFGNLAAKGCPNGSDMSSLSKSNPTIDPELGPFCCETSVKKVDVDASPSVQ
ncbi:hypothetical protein HPB50_027340 [Hyalomma asiaticum]|uniref:Uncharacterized protein n=1 Tax=Hyalomma asiaticum TaxID=266040 RepID=A0ACB7T3D8_HYAAI|nr:hypothetical protein HPB50_027340 [Hyalomma asiaticum]